MAASAHKYIETNPPEVVMSTFEVVGESAAPEAH
jgi:hypothetical protein